MRQKNKIGSTAFFFVHSESHHSSRPGTQVSSNDRRALRDPRAENPNPAPSCLLPQPAAASAGLAVQVAELAPTGGGGHREARRSSGGHVRVFSGRPGLAHLQGTGNRPLSGAFNNYERKAPCTPRILARTHGFGSGSFNELSGEHFSHARSARVRGAGFIFALYEFPLGLRREHLASRGGPRIRHGPRRARRRRRGS